MLSIEKCRKVVRGNEMSDEEIESLRSALYTLAEIMIRDYVSHTKHGCTVSDDADKERCER